MIIGLTGGLGSGKSLVSAELAHLGGRIVDADLLARQVLEPGQPAWENIRREWPEVIRSDLKIDRGRLRAQAFASSAAIARLSALTHPYIIPRLLEEIHKIPGGITVAVVPLLFEAGLERTVDQIWVVYCSHEEQVNRLCLRDGLTREEAERQISLQTPMSEKIKYAQVVIDNSSDQNSTFAQIKSAFQALIRGRSL